MFDGEGGARSATLLAAFALFALWETFRPRRPLSAPTGRRWAGHALLWLAGNMAAGFVFRAGAVAMAASVSGSAFGLLNRDIVPYWARFAAAILLLDLARYGQHYLYHAIPALWRLHQVHHADVDYDWSGHYGTDDLYTHAYPDGQVVALRRFKDIYSKQWLRSIRNLQTDFDIESAAIDRAACDVARELIDNRPCPIGGPDDFQELWKAWSSADAEGVTAGE